MRLAVSRNDVILGIVAAVLVAFSLVVSLVVPRRDPSFPGRHLRVFVLIAVLLVVGMLTAVEVLGESHHFGAEGGEPTGVTEASPTTGTTTGASTETGGGGPKGDPAAGKQIFTSVADPACSTCHTLAEAGATQTLGPNLDEGLKGKDAAFIQQSILEPDAEITPGYPDNLMPEDYGDKLDEQQIADLVAFLVQATSS
jgi:mono/diheme cytochrome c family protein